MKYSTRNVSYYGFRNFFEVNDMQDDFSWRSPRVSGVAKVNNNQLLVEENLAFIGCGVVGAAVVELLS
jgi:hypothetical protein